MEKGQMRCEPNISIQEKGKWDYKDGMITAIGDYKLNPKVEIKNIGSITAVEKSIEYEFKRLSEALEDGEEIVQQTRGWNADRGITEFQRSKETVDDYRYMAEPDIPVIEISDEDITRISKELVELPHEKIKRYKEEYKLSDYDAEVLSAEREVAEFYDDLVKKLDKEIKDLPSSAKLASNSITGIIFAWLNEKSISISQADLDLDDLVEWNLALHENEITKSKAEELLKKSLDEGEDLSELLDEFREKAEKSAGNLDDIVKKVIKENTNAVEDYKGGKKASLGFLIGQVMQKTQGTADPNEARSILMEELEK
jgi:aspartyl-tRNA(Asn)/glutamyl-tRNA(Gln) amidotransferase subunit B